ncbi:MAG: YhbY family RNA-binding protein [Clostridia bacterium]|nr:YhbY family RNA-binding protein [Clostridia bacterium]
MLNSRQRAQLRGMANGIETILHVGKTGVTDQVIKQADDALEKRELIKGRALETCPTTARETAEVVATAVGADVVQVIGSRFVLYRASREKNIKLVK